MEGSGRFLQNVSLFPLKIPSDLGGYNIIAAVVLHSPFVTSSDRKTNAQNTGKYDEGSDVRLLFIFVHCIQ